MAGLSLLVQEGTYARSPDRSRTQSTLAALRALGPQAGATKVWIFFTDKGIHDSAAYQASIQAFASTLSAHAAARRAKVFGPSLGDYADLPVNDAYVREVERLGARVVRTSRWLDAASVIGPIESLEAIADLPYVEHLAIVRGGTPVHMVPTEAGEAKSGGAGAPPQVVFNYGPSLGQLAEIRVTNLHALGLSGAGVIVAMLDTGYQRTHPAFARILAEGRLLAQHDFINDDGETMNEPGDPATQDVHGTATWSILAGFDEGNLIGPAFGASFLLAKTEDVSSETPIEEDNWVAAMEWADGLGADVISSSLSYIDWYTYSDMDGDTAISTIGADIAASRGIVVCAGAGNWATQDWHYIGAPADADSILAVGGTYANGDIWEDSSRGPTFDRRIKPEVCARGVDTYAAWPASMGGPYRYVSGTSTSCPLVAGAAALLLQAHPNWTPMQVRQALLLTADNASTPNNDRGWGRIDALGAFGFPAEAPNPTAESSGSARAPLRVWPNPSRGGGVVVAISQPGVLEILGVEGALVRRLDAGSASATASAPALLRWDGRDARARRVPPGLYFVRLVGKDGSVTRKMVVQE